MPRKEKRVENSQAIEWSAFQIRLEQARTAAQMSHADLARLVGVSPEDVRNWKYGRSRPPLSLLPAIASSLNLEPLDIPEAMGIVPPGLNAPVSKLATRLVAAEANVTALAGEVAALTADTGVRGIVATAVRTGRWGVAVWPAHEGPPTCRIHVADRLSFVRVDGGECTREALEADVGAQLSRAWALKVSAFADPQFEPRSDQLRYSIPIFTGARPPRRDVPYRGLVTLGVVSQTILAWPSDVAAHLADALGYGLTSTRTLANALYGAGGSPTDLGSRRREMLTHILMSPPDRHAWYHFDLSHTAAARENTPETDLLASHLSEHGLPLHSCVVRLRESDALLEMAVRNQRRQAGEAQVTLRDLQATRAQQDEIFQDGTDTTISVDVDLPEGATATSDSTSLREANFLRSLQVARTVLRRLQATGTVPADDDLFPSKFVGWLSSEPGGR